jgi:phosphocarrier protein FPr
MGRDSAPTEEELLAVYEQIAGTLGERPVIIRTLDIGGDKPLPYLAGQPEANPFLGLRGIRFCLANRDIFRPQLRAILRASYGSNIKLMFPMIGTLAELRSAKAEVEAVRQELRTAQLPFNEDMAVGMMIEVPSAVAIADQLAREVDFFSIGTNDLTQYVMAADRGNAQVADLADALQPAVLRLIQQTVTAAHKAGIWVGVCGELAGRPQAVPLLVGLGVDELSMNAPVIPAVKTAVRQTRKSEVEGLVTAVLNLESAQRVAEYLGIELT